MKGKYECKRLVDDSMYKLIGLVVHICIAIFFSLHILDVNYVVLKKIGVTNVYMLIVGTVILSVVMYVSICFFMNDIIFNFFDRVCSKIFSTVYKDVENNKIVYVLVYLLNKTIICTIAIVVISFLCVVIKLENSTEFKGNNIIEKIAVSIINDISSGAFIEENKKVVVLYNGTRLNEAVKGTKAIAEKVNEIVSEEVTSLAKAMCIYDWIGNNIEYDYELADSMTDDNDDGFYGARYAFENLSGICFDFASLYVVMAREAGLPVRLIIGDAFNGVEFDSHAWNQVYITEEERWINVDSTFWGEIDSFDSDEFIETHKERYIAGEW